VKADLECDLRCDPPLAIVGLAGRLDLTTAPQLRAALLKSLADQPDAVLIDATALTVADDIHLTVLISVAHHAAAWPSIPVLLCAPAAPVVEAVRRLGIDRHVIVCDSLDQGRVRAASHEKPSQLRDVLRPAPASVALARELVEDACHSWHLDRLAPRACLVVSELVSNAVCHAGTTIDLTVNKGNRNLHIAVRDYVHEPARLTGPAAEDQAGGRGLLIVEALTTCWGCIPTHDGKVVWAALSTQRP